MSHTVLGVKARLHFSPRPQHSSRHADLRVIAYEGALSNIFVVLTGGAFITGLALSLGAGDFEIGLLAALPFLAQAAQLVTVLLNGLSISRKRLSLWGLSLGRQLWWLIVPLLFLDGAWRLPVFLGLVTLSSLLTMVVAPSWLSWISDIVPASIRGRFFARRNVAVAATTLVFGITGSWLLDWFRHHGRDEVGFAMIIAAAVVASALASIVLNRLADAPSAPTESGSSSVGWMKPLADHTFRNILRVFFVWNFAIGLSAPFFAPQMLVNLKMSFLQIGFYTSGVAIVAVAVNRPWGRLIDRFGSRSVLTLCAAGIGFIPLIWLFPRANYLWILVLEGAYSGVLWTGFNLAAFTLPIDKSPREDRASYLAWFAAVTGAGFFVASIIGGLVAESLTGFSWSVGPQHFVNYHVIFVISAVLRVASVGLLYALTEPSEQKVPMMVQLMGYAVLKRLSLGRQIVPFAVEGTDRPEENVK
jgi:MFS family permease